MCIFVKKNDLSCILSYKMSEFERECEEYGCSPITKQWDNVVDMLLAQSEPKDHKKEKKIWEK